MINGKCFKTPNHLMIVKFKELVRAYSHVILKKIPQNINKKNFKFEKFRGIRIWYRDTFGGPSSSVRRGLQTVVPISGRGPSRSSTTLRFYGACFAYQCLAFGLATLGTMKFTSTKKKVFWCMKVLWALVKRLESAVLACF